jgi:serine/threonine-protein kinase HipA
MQSLAAFTGVDFQTPGSLDYANFLRATQLCTNDMREKAVAFARAVFNVAFNNRDDHPKNFAYLMSKTGQWTLAPAYDVTFCEGPGGYYQMDVMGQALEIDRKNLLRLGTHEAELSAREAASVIDQICDVASTFAAVASGLFAGQITPGTLRVIQGRINDNIGRLR